MVGGVTAGRGRLRYEPALDGVRAVAVVAVLLFHGGFAWATGGFLGVSVFFTLSGFLITSLLLAEHEAGGSIALRSFWGRRLRRLLPASLVCIVGVTVLLLIGELPRTATTRGDLWGALADVANWRFYFSGQSYAQLFATPSPLQHFWSLAIEEQFYVVYPLLVWAVLAKARWSRHTLAVLLVTGWLASAAANVLLGGRNPDLVYQATFTRAAELLTGAIAAIVVRELAARRGVREPRRSAAAALGVLGLAAVAGLAYLTATTDQNARWLYRGGFAAFSFLSLALVVGARQPGVLRAVLGWAPLAWIGRISYGLYLYHWPIFLLLSPQRTDLARGPLFALRAAVTLAVAVVSYYAIEQPIRRERVVRGARSWPLAPASLGIVALAVTAVTPGAAPAWAATPTTRDVEVVAVRGLSDTTTASTAPVTTTAAATADPAAASSPSASTEVAPSLPPPPSAASVASSVVSALGRPVRILLAGDSTANAFAPGLTAWATESGVADVDVGAVKVGCGYVRDGKDKFGPKPRDIVPTCGDIVAHLDQAASASGADVAIVVDGPWEVTDHQAPGDTWRSPGDPKFDARLTDALGTATDTLLRHVPLVVWTTSPVIHPGWGFATPDPAWEPERMAVLNRIIRQVAADRPGRVLVVDYGSWLDGQAAGMDASFRPDGVHLSPEAARTVADWLGPQVVAAVQP